MLSPQYSAATAPAFVLVEHPLEVLADGLGVEVGAVGELDALGAG
jgi:hypothetical protein